MTALTSNLIVRLIDQVTGPARGVEKSIRRINRAGGDATAPASFADRMAQAQSGVGAAIEKNNAALDQMRGRMIGATAGAYGLKMALSAPIRAASSFEDAMADVRKVVDFSSDASFRAFTDELDALSKRVPVSVDGLAQIAAAAGQAGIAGEDLVRFTEEAARIGTAFDISADQAGDAMAKLMTGLDRSINDTVLLSDAINHLSNSQASSAAEVLDVVMRVGAQAKTFGYSAEQAAAFGSAMIASGAQSEVAATSFRNMGRALTRGASATKRQSTAFDQLGLDATEVARRMQKDAVGTTVDVLERIAELPKEMRAAVSSDLFGNEARALGPLLTNLDLVHDSLGLVADESAYSGSAFDEFTARLDTFSNAMQIFGNHLSSLNRTIGESLLPSLKQITERIAPIIDRVRDFAATYPDLTRNIVAATTALISFRVATAALSFVGLIGKGGALSMLAVGLRGITRLGTPIARFFETLALRNVLAASSLGRTPGILSRIADAGLVLVRMVPGVSLIGKAFAAVGAALAGITAPVWAGIAAGALAVAGAGAALWRYWDRISATLSGVGRRITEELAPAFEMLGPALKLAKPVIEGIGDAIEGIGEKFGRAREKLQKFVDWVGSFFEREVLTDEQKARAEQSGYDFADRIIEGIKSVFIGFPTWVFGWVDDVVDAAGSLDLTQVGEKAVASLKAAFFKFLDWIEGLPQMVLDRIGEIDLTNVVKLPWGREKITIDAVTNDQELADTLAMAERIAELQSREGGVLGWGGDLTGEEAAELAELREAMAEITAGLPDTAQRDMAEYISTLQDGGEGAREQADDLAQQLTDTLSIEARPEVDTGSIDAAIERVRRLRAEVDALDSAGSSEPSPRPKTSRDWAKSGHRASGGPVWPGSSFLVGEREPEIFTPSTGGEITPVSAVERATKRAQAYISAAMARLAELPDALDQMPAANLAPAPAETPGEPSPAVSLETERAPASAPAEYEAPPGPAPALDQMPAAEPAREPSPAPAPAPAVAPVAARGGMTLNGDFIFNIDGTGDPEGVARRVARIFEDELGSMIRGAHAGEEVRD